MPDYNVELITDIFILLYAGVPAFFLYRSYKKPPLPKEKIESAKKAAFTFGLIAGILGAMTSLLMAALYGFVNSSKGAEYAFGAFYTSILVAIGSGAILYRPKFGMWIVGIGTLIAAYLIFPMYLLSIIFSTLSLSKALRIKR